MSTGVSSKAIGQLLRLCGILQAMTESSRAMAEMPVEDEMFRAELELIQTRDSVIEQDTAEHAISLIDYFINQTVLIGNVDKVVAADTANPTNNKSLHKQILLLPGAKLKNHLIQNRTHKAKAVLTPVLEELIAHDILSRELDSSKGRPTTVYVKADTKNMEAEQLMEVQMYLSSIGMGIIEYERAVQEEEMTTNSAYKRRRTDEVITFQDENRQPAV